MQDVEAKCFCRASPKFDTQSVIPARVVCRQSSKATNLSSCAQRSWGWAITGRCSSPRTRKRRVNLASFNADRQKRLGFVTNSNEQLGAPHNSETISSHTSKALYTSVSVSPPTSAWPWLYTKVLFTSSQVRPAVLGLACLFSPQAPWAHRAPSMLLQALPFPLATSATAEAQH